MLAHGCLDQDTISNAILEIQDRLGCNFSQETFAEYLYPLEERCTEGRLSSKSRKPSQHGAIQQQLETRPATGKTMSEFDHVLEVRSQENEERRHYLKEQERLRTKIMGEVLARKRSYLNIRAPEERAQRAVT